MDRIIAFEDNNLDFRLMMNSVEENSLGGLVEGVSILPCIVMKTRGAPIYHPRQKTMIDQLGFMGVISAIRISEGMDLGSFLQGADRTIKQNWRY